MRQGSDARHWSIVSLFALLYILSFIDRLILAMLVEPVRHDLSISDSQIAILIGPAFAFMYALLGLPVAWLVDRGNRMRLAACGVALWCMATMLSGFATRFEHLLILRVGVALGEAVLSPAAVSIIPDLFPKQRRSAPVAVFVASGTVGVALAYAAGGGLIAAIRHGMLDGMPLLGGLPVWRVTLILLGAPGLLLALCLMVVREPRRGGAEDVVPGADPVRDDGRFGAFASRGQATAFYLCFFLGSATGMTVSYGALAWYPTFLVRAFGADIGEAGIIFSPALVIAALLGLGLPIVAERWARKGRPDALLTLILVVLPAGFLLFGLSLLQSDIRAAMPCVIVGLGLLSGTNGLPSVIVALTAPAGLRGRLMAVNLASSNVIGLGLGPVIIAQLSDHLFTGPRALGTSMLVLLVAAAPLSWLLIRAAWRPYRQAMADVSSPATGATGGRGAPQITTL